NVHIHILNHCTSRKDERNELTIIDKLGSQIDNKLFLHTLDLVDADCRASATRTKVIMYRAIDVTASTCKNVITERSLVSCHYLFSLNGCVDIGRVGHNNTSGVEALHTKTVTT